ncbi:MAG: hypothetical protein KBC53_04045 [Nitrosomonas sp.]|nr:hypothetical protein [Nitrosomonas sp.]
MIVVRSDAPFYWPLRGSIVLQNGSGAPAFARATTKWMFNDEGKLIKLPSGAIEMRGYRPVINQFTGNTDNCVGLTAGRITNTDSAALDSDGTNKAGAWRLNASAGAHYLRLQSSAFAGLYINICFKIKLTSYRYISLRIDSYINYYDLQTQSWNGALQGISRDATVSGGWVMLSMSAGPMSSGSLVYGLEILSAAWAQSWTPAGTEEITVYQAMLADVTGWADKGFPGYAAGHESYGAGANGVKFFATNKDGVAIPEATLLGARLNPNQTINTLLWCRDFTNVVWTASNTTPTKNQTGLGGIANSCSLLTATAANGTILQTITAAASAGCSGFYVKRSVGTGSIYITRDGGSNWTDVTSLINSSNFTLVKIENTSVTNPQVGFKIATSGDSIIVDFGINHLGTKISDPIETSGASVTVNADVLTLPTAGNFSDTAGTILATVNKTDWTGGNGSVVGSATRGLYASASNSGAQGLDGTNTVNGPAGTPSGTMRIGIRWSGSSLQAFSNGSFGSVGSYDGAFNLASIAAMAGAKGAIKDIAIWPSSLSDSDMISASDSIVFNLVNGSAAALSIAAQNGFEITGRTIDASIAALSFTSQNGLEIIGRTIDASITPLEFSMIDGNVIMGRTIDGDIINLSLDDQDGQMIIGRTISGEIAPIAIITKAGMVLLDDSPRSAVTIAATLASPTITARL